MLISVHPKQKDESYNLWRILYCSWLLSIKKLLLCMSNNAVILFKCILSHFTEYEKGEGKEFLIILYFKLYWAKWAWKKICKILINATSFWETLKVKLSASGLTCELLIFYSMVVLFYFISFYFMVRYMLWLVVTVQL